MKIDWLASFPKSGNTWVRCVLEAYARGKVDLNLMGEVLGDSNIMHFQQLCPAVFDSLTMQEWLIYRVAMLSNMRMHHAKNHKRMILKTHNAHVQVGDMPTIPLALSGLAVYIIRNPLDVMPSLAAHMGMTYDGAVEKMCHEGFATESDAAKGALHTLYSSWKTNVASWERYPNVLVVRYEDLKDDPKKWFGKIIRHYGYSYSSKKLDAAIRTCKLDRLKAQENKDGFREASKVTKFFGQKHKPILKRQEKALIKGLGPTMEKYGYL